MATKKPKASEAPSKAAITPIKKITVAAVWGKVNLRDIPEGEELLLCRISGIAEGTKRGESNYGSWTALKGNMAATNSVTGEIFMSGAAFIPSTMGEALAQSLDAKLLEDASSTLTFAVDVSVIVSPRDVNKYEYIVRPVIENDFFNPAIALLGLD